MLHAFFDFIFHRQSWRNVSFSELSELYASLLLRTMALSLIGIFVPVYLYQIGFSVADIAVFFMIIRGSRLLIDPIITKLIRNHGAKQMLRISYLSLIVNLGLLLLLQYFSIPLVLVALSESFATGAFYLSFNLEFSKLKNARKEGRELGAAFAWQKIGGVMGPITGGLVASFFGIEYTILAAMLVLALAAIPSMLTPEMLKTAKYERFRYSDWRMYKRDFWPAFGFGLNGVGATHIWPLFIGIVVFQENVYAGLGLVTTISLFMAITMAHFFGRVIDDKKGRSLLNWSSVVSGIGMFIRPFINTLGGVLTLSVVVEPLTSGVVMPFTKGYYDASDRVGKRRLSYITTLIAYMHMSRFLLWFIVWLFAVFVNEISALEIAFVASGIGTLLITAQRFEALRR